MLQHNEDLLGSGACTRPPGETLGPQNLACLIHLAGEKGVQQVPLRAEHLLLSN